MAVGLRGLFRLNIGLTNSLFSKTNFINAGVRFMYTDRDLGILSYENTRFVFRNQFVSIEDTFRTKMKEICKKEDGVIFTEDLKAMIHLAQGNEEDMQLVADMLQKFAKAKGDRQFGSYVFGPIVMRMLYYLNEPRMALSLFSNPDLVNIFMYHSSFKTLLCLLLKHQMYQEVRDVYENVTNLKGIEFSIVNSILLYAACYKQNTPESAEYALKHWREHCKLKIPSSRSTSLVAYLAIKHDRSEDALEILSVSSREYSIGIRSLKVLAHTRLQRYLHIIPILKHSTEQDTSVPHRHGYYAEVIYELEEKLKKDNVSEAADILPLISKLKQQQRIETDRTLDEYLFRPLLTTGRTRGNEKENANLKGNMRSESRVGFNNYL